MVQIVIRGLNPGVVQRLRSRARQHGRSLQREAKLILERAAGMTFEEAVRVSNRWQSKLKGSKHTDSAELLREDRQR